MAIRKAFNALVWLLPLISAAMWLALLLSLLLVWVTDGSPHFPSMDQDQKIAYISDVGAYGLKPLFITGAVITTVFLDLSFAAERWLRHTGRLARNLGIAEKVLSALSIVCAIGGTSGLVLLSIFDTYHHPRLHDGFLLLFMAGYLLTAIFNCAEYQRLGVHFRNIRILRISFWLKLFFILFEVALVIVFGVLMFRSNQDAAAVFEWAISFVFTLYILTFFIDLIPASRSVQEKKGREVLHQLEEQNATNFAEAERGNPTPTTF